MLGFSSSKGLALVKQHEAKLITEKVSCEEAENAFADALSASVSGEPQAQEALEAARLVRNKARTRLQDAEDILKITKAKYAAEIKAQLAAEEIRKWKLVEELGRELVIKAKQAEET